MGAFPPLANSQWLERDPEILARILLHGLNGPIRVRGATYNNVMLAHKETLSDQEIADVLTYARNSWGNRASAVTAQQVAAIRAKEAARDQPWTAAELDALEP